MSEALNFVGNADAVAVDGLEKILGTAKYVGDMVLPGMLHAKVLASPVPHARIVELDIRPALDVEGVVAAITSEDFIDHGHFGWPVKDAYILAYQKVRYVGDPIAVVAAESLAAAEAGVQAIMLKLEELPVVGDMNHALDAEAALVPLEAPLGQGNLLNTHLVRNGDPEPILTGCDFVVDESYTFQAQEHAYLETEGVLAIPEPGGTVTVFANNQSPHINRDNAAGILGLPAEDVRIIQPPVGGSFGGKDDHVYQFTAHTAKLSLLTGRPVRLLLNREESSIISYKRAAANTRLRMGMTADGTLRAAKIEYLTDSGAYASMTPLASWRATMHLAGAYRYEAATVDTKSIYTNNGYAGAFRGFGNTQAAAASEIAIDELAEIIGMDPIEFRLKNCLRTGDRAFTGNTLQHDVGLTQCLEWVRDKSGWIDKRESFSRNEAEDSLKGIGVACYFHGSGLGGEGTDYARITMTVERDHSVTLQTGLTDYGQGSRTVFTMVAAETLSINPERIHMLRPDTDTALESGPTVASRASIVGGNATQLTAEKIRQKLELAAADLLECSPDQLLRHGEAFIGPNEEPLSVEDVIDHAFEMGMQMSSQGYWQIPQIHWDFEKGSGIPYYTYSFGAQIAEVSVSKSSGKVKVTGIWASHDGGTIIFPKGARGQLLGGIAQGIGYALTEGFSFVDGYPQKKNLKQYKIPTALDVPEIETYFVPTTLPEGPFGAKNLAEPVMIATTPAIANAVFHATGVRCRDFPISTEWLRSQFRK
ncbi:MAG: xanthine dehydrogenase family protein [Anaerolineales bacterium]|nr:xanthine dehydrogenase family protein [Chloroflexota bacterium]MBL6983170.1 xanthine dehydrogenase family protein [Anaerolineales bacterium]